MQIGMCEHSETGRQLHCSLQERCTRRPVPAAEPPACRVPHLGGCGVLCEAVVVAGAVIPGWVAPGDREVVDCHRLAADQCDRLRADGGNGNFEAGVVAAVGWVVGLGRSPIADEEVLASAEAAEAEFFAAGEVEFGTSPRGAVVPVEAAQGVGRTLAWLLGWEPRPPVALPRRPVPSAEQLFDEALAAEPHRRWLPEERELARSAAVREAGRLAELAARADALAQSPSA
jgi:hypothetical protein